MWGGGGNNDGGSGGGYFNDTMQTTPGSDPNRKVYKAQNCVPVSIQQIKDSKEDDFKIGQNTDVHLVTILALLVKKESDSTKSSYLFDDCSGRINAFIFNYNENGVSSEKDYEIDRYYRVFGSVRIQDKKHHIMTFKLQLMENLDELTMHLLEVIYVPLHLDEQDLQSNDQSSMIGSHMGAGASDTRSSFMNAGTGNDSSIQNSTNSGLTGPQQAIYKAIKACTHSIGLDKNTLPDLLTIKMSSKELDVNLEFLTSEGHIYSTVDEQHFRSTDN